MITDVTLAYILHLDLSEIGSCLIFSKYFLLLNCLLMFYNIHAGLEMSLLITIILM